MISKTPHFALANLASARVQRRQLQAMMADHAFAFDIAHVFKTRRPNGLRNARIVDGPVAHESQGIAQHCLGILRYLLVGYDHERGSEIAVGPPSIVSDQNLFDAAIGGADEFLHRAAVGSFAKMAVKPARDDDVLRIAHDEDDLSPGPKFRRRHDRMLRRNRIDAVRGVVIVARKAAGSAARELPRFQRSSDWQLQRPGNVVAEQETVPRPARLRIGDDEDVGVFAKALDFFFVTANPDALMNFLQQGMLFTSPYVSCHRVQKIHRDTLRKLCGLSLNAIAMLPR